MLPCGVFSGFLLIGAFIEVGDMNKSFAFAGDQVVGQLFAQKLQDAGFVLAAGMASADYIFTYALTQTQIEDIYLGTGGAIESAKEGCCLIDLSPSTQTLAKEVYAIARVNELQSLDAPIVLKDPCEHDAFGNTDNVMMLVGGEDDAVADAMPLLQVIADDVRTMGLPGSGQLAKAMCTVQQASSVVSLVEARALARAQGEDAVAAVDAAVDAGFAAPAARGIYHAMVDGHFHGTYNCTVMMAELTSVMNGAEEIDLVLPQAEACQHLLELFLVVGGADLAVPALALAYAADDESASYGLDWSRADGMYEHDHEHHHEHEHDHDHYDEYDEYDEYGYEYGFEDDGDDYAGGFGGFSAN
jgi:3-hydroxyisobutyrate dehydrogenase